jgi:hypothetical protein
MLSLPVHRPGILEGLLRPTLATDARKNERGPLRQGEALDSRVGSVDVAVPGRRRFLFLGLLDHQGLGG